MFAEMGSLHPIDDIEHDVDPNGELKVTPDGTLLGGRKYSCRTYLLPRHPSRLYMLTMDLCKVLGYRDSYVFFRKNPHIPRLDASDDDKEVLIQHGLVSHHFKSNRVVPLVTARSAFQEFGHLVIKGGQPGTDDYWTDGRKGKSSDEELRRKKTEMAQDSDGEPVDFASNFVSSRGASTEPLDKPGFTFQQRFSSQSFGLQNYQHSSAFPSFDSSSNIYHKTPPRDVIRSCMSAADYNSRLLSARQMCYFDIHTNREQYPKSTQPKHIHIQVDPSTFQEPTILESLPPFHKKPKTEHRLDDKVYFNKVGTVHGIAGTLDEKPEDVWSQFEETEDMLRYPIAIIPGQPRAALSIFPTRFEGYDALTIQKLVEQERKQIVAALSTSSLDAQEEDDEDQNTVVDVVASKSDRLVCGYLLTADRGLCQKPVSEPGELCPRHYRMSRKEQGSHVPEEGQYDQPCCICHEQIPPTLASVEGAKEHPGALLLLCSNCRLTHHAMCVDLSDPTQIAKVQTYSWTCANCKVCSVCIEAGDESKLLFCDACDRGYHMTCLKPPLKKLPEGVWLCVECAVCVSCGKTQSESAVDPEDEWKHAQVSSAAAPSSKNKRRSMPKKSDTAPYLGTYCSQCYNKFATDEFCPLCLKVYDEEEDTPMVCCDQCDRWIHVGCDPDLTQEMYDGLAEKEDSNYTCLLCNPTRLNQVVQELGSSSTTGRPFVQVVSHHGKPLTAPALKTLLS